MEQLLWVAVGFLGASICIPAAKWLLDSAVRRKRERGEKEAEPEPTAEWIDKQLKAVPTPSTVTRTHGPRVTVTPTYGGIPVAEFIERVQRGESISPLMYIPVIKELIWRERQRPHTPEVTPKAYIPRGLWNASYTLVAGIWVEDGLYYKALGLGELRAETTPTQRDAVPSMDLAPGVPEERLGRCIRCNRSWKWFKPHCTMFRETEGFGPLCEICWGEMSVDVRLHWYRHKWVMNSNVAGVTPEALNQMAVDWPLIEAAIMEGK